jgi:hypothetical protein
MPLLTDQVFGHANLQVKNALRSIFRHCRLRVNRQHSNTALGQEDQDAAPGLPGALGQVGRGSRGRRRAAGALEDAIDQRWSPAAKGAWPVSDESTAILQGQLERAVTGHAEARQRLLELTRDRLSAGVGNRDINR